MTIFRSAAAGVRRAGGCITLLGLRNLHMSEGHTIYFC